MNFLESLYPLFRSFLILAMVIMFIWALGAVIHWKLHKILTAINSVIKLEVSDRIGRICLSGIILFIVVFLVCFISDDAFKLVARLLPPDAVAHSINLNMMFVVTILTFFLNLIVLAWLKGARPK